MSSTVPISIMTFNILAENCVDFVNPAEYYPHITPKNLRINHRLPGIIKKIRQHNCDIVLLQELTYEVREKLVKLLPEYLCTKLAVNNLHEPKRLHWANMTLLKRGVFSSIKHIVQFLHTSHTAYSTLVCKHHASGKKCIIMNVHYDAEYPVVRRYENAALLRFLRSYLSNWIIVVGGDFNTDDPTLHAKFEGKFLPAIPKKRASSTYLCEAPMIDHIYTRGIVHDKSWIDNKAYCDDKKDCKNVKEKTPQCMRKTISSVSSDHYPVVLFGHIKIE